MNARTVITLLALAALLSGCATLPTIQPEDTDLSGWVESQEPPPPGTGTVKVKTAAGETVSLKQPHLFDDQYSGWAVRKGRRTFVEIPVDSIVGYRYVRLAQPTAPCHAGSTEEVVCGLMHALFGAAFVVTTVAWPTGSYGK